MFEDFISSQKVWFPTNDIWYDILNNKKYEGGQIETITKNIYAFPLFVKGGTPLPMQPYKQHMASAILDTLVLRCYPGQPGRTGTYTLYEDDGISNDYLTGAYLLTRLSYTQQSSSQAILSVERSGGNGYMGQPRQRVYKIELPNSKPLKVLINGKKTKILNGVDGPFILSTPKLLMNKDLKVCITERL